MLFYLKSTKTVSLNNLDFDMKVSVGFMSLLTVFQSYPENERIIIKDCVLGLEISSPTEKLEIATRDPTEVSGSEAVSGKVKDHATCKQRLNPIQNCQLAS